MVREVSTFLSRNPSSFPSCLQNVTVLFGLRVRAFRTVATAVRIRIMFFQPECPCADPGFPDGVQVGLAASSGHVAVRGPLRVRQPGQGHPYHGGLLRALPQARPLHITALPVVLLSGSNLLPLPLLQLNILNK